jgi:hypothetical protein
MILKQVGKAKGKELRAKGKELRAKRSVDFRLLALGPLLLAP